MYSFQSNVPSTRIWSIDGSILRDTVREVCCDLVTQYGPSIFKPGPWP